MVPALLKSESSPADRLSEGHGKRRPCHLFAAEKNEAGEGVWGGKWGVVSKHFLNSAAEGKPL